MTRMMRLSVIAISVMFLCSAHAEIEQSSASACFCYRDCPPGTHLVRRINSGAGYSNCVCDCVANDDQHPSVPSPPKQTPQPPSPPKQTPQPPKQKPAPPPKQKPAPPSNDDCASKLLPPLVEDQSPILLKQMFEYDIQCYQALSLISPCINAVYGIYGPSTLYPVCCSAFRVTQTCGSLNPVNAVPPEAISICNANNF
ncbi:conserved hypothetical protein [Ricinus communis]|uniref:Bifunctional inhibitor/plant lipid transfer protein/seed storage helical domain-containing protein n=1 Tax=Ricinus communis TaxID=3988 RepID=B9T252_RICCO|nr:conserved hypothetical protein [Ricinus communis]